MAKIPSLLLLAILPLLVILESEADDQLQFLYHVCNNRIGNITSDSNYGKNRDAVFSKILSDRKIDYGFYNFSYGEDPDKVYAIALCRGDIPQDRCHSCLEKSAALLGDRCRVQKEAYGWYDECMLRYSNRSIFGVMETGLSHGVVHCTPTNQTSDIMFNQTVHDLLNKVKRTASAGDSRHKFGEGDSQVQSSNDTIYALVQCTPDLSNQDCTQCLESAFSDISNFCDAKRAGGRYDGPSCFATYETHPFFLPMLLSPAPQPSQPLPFTSPPPTPPVKPGKRKISPTTIALVVAVFAVMGLLVFFCIYLGVRKATRKHLESDEADEVEPDNDIKTTELLQFDIATIRSVTNNFSDANKLGQGGFGTVYKGALPDGQEVAIKRLSTNSNQGETEFKNEVLLTGKLQHRNLVRLLGFCLARRERLLIYEFVSNKSLDYIIFDPAKRAHLNWEIRHKIIRGIARGLLYLHEDSRLQIIHRDLKTSNILLDEELNPKISDFGMARLFQINQIQDNTSTIVGTFGYMAPEYVKHGQFSVKSDVFSFGVIILEIVCGRKNNGIQNAGENVEDLLSLAWKNWKGETTSNIIDPTLKDYSGKEIMRCIHVGLLCVQEDIADRPTMNSVLLMLNSSSFPLVEPSEPAFLIREKSSLPKSSGEQYSEATKSSDSGSQSAQDSSNKAPITDLYPR